MNKKFLLAFLFSFSLLFSILSCSRINEATGLGVGVIPAVDGITTFDSSFTIEAYNDYFTSLNDSIFVSRFDDHFLGNIGNDPIFGKTNAKIFMELKPTFYPWNFSGVYNKDSLKLDSVVLVLDYKGTYGDTTAMQRVKVYEMNPLMEFRYDSAYQIRKQYFTYSNLLGSKDFTPQSLKDSFLVFKDTIKSVHQLRIRLNDNFGNRLLKQFDTTNAYKSDSIFKDNLKGFAIEADPSMGNALMSFSLYNNPITSLAIYYKYTKDGVVDSAAVTNFQFTDISAQHNFIDRNINGTPMLAAQGGTTPDDYVYLINTPGSFATLKIPELRNLNNRIVHRAEIIMEEVYDPSDKTFIPPQALYLDVYDSLLSAYKVIPYDYLPDNTGQSQVLFGMYGNDGLDASGNPIRTWRFNITRYIQNYLTKKEPFHDFRLLTHISVYTQMRENNGSNTGSYGFFAIPINSVFAAGRVRLGGGTHPTQRMKLRMVYTKI